MASAGETFYSGYKAETEKHNVKPEIVRGFEEVFAWRQANGLDLRKTYSHSTRFWDCGTVHRLDDGRVVEYSQTNSAIGTPLLAIFPDDRSHLDYRNAMPIHTYLHG